MCFVLFFQCRLKSLTGLPWLLSGKESTCQCRRHEFHPQSGRSSGGGNGIPLQYFCLENPMDRGAWRATVQRVKRVKHNWECMHSASKFVNLSTDFWICPCLGAWWYGRRRKIHCFQCLLSPEKKPHIFQMASPEYPLLEESWESTGIFLWRQIFVTFS